MRRFFRENSLSIVMFGLFFVFLAAQSAVDLSEAAGLARVQAGRPPAQRNRE